MTAIFRYVGSKTLHGFTVTYNSVNHCQVLNQCWGSIWSKVIPYCLFNVALSMMLQFVEGHHLFHFRFTDKGHAFMTLLIAFLVVTRATGAIGRYNQVRSSLEDLYSAQRQLTHQIMICSSDNSNQSAKEWRHEVTYLSLLHLRCTMLMIGDTTDSTRALDLPEFDDVNRALVKEQLSLQQTSQPFTRYAQYLECDHNVRVPVCLAFSLRRAIVSQRTRLERPLAVFEELALLNTIDSITNAYFGIRYFMMVPFPFPLVQMTRTILFFYVFTLPFALLQDVSIPLAHLIVVFFLTYGFLGIEYVSIELDHPFGDDPNDFDSIRMAQISFEDTYTVLTDIDGEEWAGKLREKMGTESLSTLGEHRDSAQMA